MCDRTACIRSTHFNLGIDLNTTWQKFLTDRSDTHSDVKRNLITGLLDDGLIRVSGKDALTFLQGQLTNDVKLITPEQGQLNGYCSPKGRLLAVITMFQRGEDLYISMPIELIEATLKRLRMFVLRSDCKLEDESDKLVGFGVSGPDALAGLASIMGNAPETPFASVQNGETTALRLPAETPRFLVYAPVDAAIEYFNQLESTFNIANNNAWQLLDVLSGVPRITAESQDTYTPQMVNLQLTGGISFTKGCYTGQEIVARTQYLGKLKRRLFLLKQAHGESPFYGKEVFAGGKEIGKVLRAVTQPEGGAVIQAVLNIEAAESEANLEFEGGQSLEVLPLPNSVTRQA